jgi:uncharacterized protein (TIGR02147 family)
MVDIYAYENFRDFLADAFASMRKESGKLTHRDFATKAGFTNPGYFNDVVKGRRSLSKSATEKISAALALKAGEADYFRLLVDYGQAKREALRHELYQRMLFRRNRSSFVRVKPGASRYYQDYHYPLIRSALLVTEFRGDYDRLSRFLRPPVPVTVVKKCIRDLCEWGLIEQGKDGRYRPIASNQEPPASLGDMVKRLNKEWVAQAGNALFQFTREERHISSSLLTVDADAYAEILKKVEIFREEVFALAKREQNPDRVLQFSIQLFPRSHIKEGGRHEA